MDSNTLLLAVAIALLIEGFFPLLAPALWRKKAGGAGKGKAENVARKPQSTRPAFFGQIGSATASTWVRMFYSVMALSAVLTQKKSMPKPRISFSRFQPSVPVWGA